MYRVYMKGLYKSWWWVLHSKAIHKVRMDMDPPTFPFGVRCVPPRSSLVRDVNNTYRWISRGGPTVWPPRSCGFLRVGKLKAFVYSPSLMTQKLGAFWMAVTCLQNPRHLWMFSTVNDTTRPSMYWISRRTLSAHCKYIREMKAFTILSGM
jgi:hypothetical protein